MTLNRKSPSTAETPKCYAWHAFPCSFSTCTQIEVIRIKRAMRSTITAELRKPRKSEDCAGRTNRNPWVVS